MRLLILLLDRPGELHTREELQHRLWPNHTFVEFDDGLNTAIQKIRQVLGDEARNPRFVETVPRQGYRFIAPVQLVESTPAPAHLEPHPVAAPPPLARVQPQPEPAASPIRPDKAPFDWRVAAAAAALAGVALGWMIAQRQPGSPQALKPMRLSIMPPPGVQLRPGIRGGSAISPDGLSVVFAASREGKHQLWLRRLDASEALPLPGTEGGILPFWSPDGASIGFQSAGKIRRLELSGGAPRELAPVSRPTRGGWASDGSVLFATGSGGPLGMVKATGGPASTATPVQTGGAAWPYPIPGTDRFLYYDKLSRKVHLGSLSPGVAPLPLLAADSNAIYAGPFDGRPGQLLWLKGAALMAQAFDAQTGRLSGDAAVVADGVGFADRWRFADLTASSNGVLLFGAGNSMQSRLAWVNREGAVTQLVGEPDWLRSVRLDSTGRRALIERGMPRALWVFDFDTSVFTRATFEPEWSGWPVWSPDGNDIAYSGERQSGVALYRRSAKGGPEVKLNSKPGFDDYLYDWSRDGHLIYCEVHPDTKLDLWVTPADATQGGPRPFLQSGFNEDQPQFSPDGRWVVYVSDESGRNEVYVTSFPRAEGKWQISTEGGSMPRWGDNGEIFFETAAGAIVAVKTRPGARQFEWLSPRRLFANPIPGRAFDISPGGDRLLMTTPVDSRSHQELTVILNWQAALPR